MTRPGDGIHTELVEALAQEAWYLLTRRLPTISLPEPVLTAAGARSRSLRQQMSRHRADARRAD